MSPGDEHVVEGLDGLDHPVMAAMFCAEYVGTTVGKEAKIVWASRMFSYAFAHVVNQPTPWPIGVMPRL